MSQPPQQPPPGYGPPNVIINQNRRGCGTIFLVILGILFLIGIITVVMFVVGVNLS
jgi:hypothetical protein